MGEFPRKADGRRVFTPEFKREVVQQILKGEKSLAELSREHDIQPTVIREWKRQYESGATTAVRVCKSRVSPTPGPPLNITQPV
jgi:transposase-like protein